MQHLKLLKLASKSRASTGQEGLRVDATCVKNCEDSNMVWVYTTSIPPVKSESGILLVFKSRYSAVTRKPS